MSLYNCTTLGIHVLPGKSTGTTVTVPHKISAFNLARSCGVIFAPQSLLSVQRWARFHLLDLKSLFGTRHVLLTSPAHDLCVELVVLRQLSELALQELALQELAQIQKKRNGLNEHRGHWQ